MKKPIRVAIVDDHTIVRQGLHNLLNRPGIEVVGEACNGLEAVNLAKQTQPDVMLLDIRMKDGDGLQSLPEIRLAAPQTSIIMLTTYTNPSYLARALEDGAIGYLSKECDPEQIIGAVQAAVTGNQLFDRSVLSQILTQTNEMEVVEPESEEPTQNEYEDLADPISEREEDVLRLLASGLSNAAIADQLNVSVATVKTHVQHILRKLDVSDRTQAALWAVRNGIIS